jgi:hypothetical protein
MEDSLYSWEVKGMGQESWKGDLLAKNYRSRGNKPALSLKDLTFTLILSCQLERISAFSVLQATLFS